MKNRALIRLRSGKKSRGSSFFSLSCSSCIFLLGRDLQINSSLSMGFVVERVEWEPGSRTFIWIFCSCFASIALLPYASKKSVFAVTANSRASHSSLVEFSSATFLSFQRNFLLVYSLASGSFFSLLFQFSPIQLNLRKFCKILLKIFFVSFCLRLFLSILGNFYLVFCYQ